MVTSAAPMKKDYLMPCALSPCPPEPTETMKLLKSDTAAITADPMAIPFVMALVVFPAEIEDRAIPGHWEGDLLGGTKNSHIATLVERHSRFTALVKVPSKDTAAVVAALSRHVRKLPASLRRSLTWDRGLEMAKHKSFTVATNVKVYFCDPQSPWQRGTNENTNGLLRQYFPKRTDLSGLYAGRARPGSTAFKSTSSKDFGV